MRIIAGAYRGRTLKTTTGPGFRPAMGKVREALFSMLEARGMHWPGARVLDLYAGSGSLGFEALSRGAAQAHFVEAAPYAVKVIAANAALLGLEPGRVRTVQQDALACLAVRAAEPFDLVFIDPPYAKDAIPSCLKHLARNNWLSPGALVNAEVEAGRPFDPEAAPDALELLADRAYGQTRVLVWAHGAGESG